MSDEKKRRQRHILIGRGSRALCGVLVRFYEGVFVDLQQAESALALDDEDEDQPCDDCVSIARVMA